MTFLIAVDPGKDKCGLILADIDHKLILDGKVCLSNDVTNVISSWQSLHSINFIILGDGTSSNYWYPILSEFGRVKVVNEMGSTFRARARYWVLWPRPKWMFWIPIGLTLPPENLDAVAALVILEDYLEKKFTWQGTFQFKT